MVGSVTHAARGSALGGAGGGKPKPQVTTPPVPVDAVAPAPAPALSSPAVPTTPHAAAVPSCIPVVKLSVGKAFVISTAKGLGTAVGVIGGTSALAATGALDPLFDTVMSSAADAIGSSPSLKAAAQDL